MPGSMQDQSSARRSGRARVRERTTARRRARTTPTSSRMNSGPVVGNVPDDGGTPSCARVSLRSRASGSMIQYRATHIQMPPAVVKNVPLAVRPANADPLLLPCDMNAYSTSRESVRAVVRERLRVGLARRARERRAEQHGGHRHEDRRGRHLHLVRLDLLAEELGCSADHQAGDEHADDREDQQAVQPRADAAERHLAELHQKIGDNPPSGE